MNVSKTNFKLEESVPDWLRGLWRRRSIEKNGERDTATQVYWLQTAVGFADIRIPAERLAVESLVGLTPEQATGLSRQDGFAGITRLKGDQCEWHHAMDYRSFTGEPDVGRLYWEGDILIEIGPNEAYKEEWQRVTTGPTAAMTISEGADWKKWLVLCDGYFIYVSDGRNFSSVDNLWDFEISFGQCQRGQKPWEIQLSTLPWKEGSSLWEPEDMAVDSHSAQIIQTVGAQSLVWTVQEWGELAQLFEPQLSRA